ncbi:hypothetical protein DXG03_002752 [Asterophora parasitica]|uniref:Uncharacterized protein n=1 Tax=Asterophora parasitica TaxID=117018 RepID=A0A9P7G226_9AGAR|nr:hypothetical protein DXG03_002752 [Asterophora parasitica]
MCETCRGRHRVYASTKRARRKLEKAAVLGMRRIGAVVSSEDEESTTTGTTTTTTTTTATANATSTATAPTDWPGKVWDDTAIDPQLFAEPAGPSHAPMHLAYGAPFAPSSSSSALAGALTLPAPPPQNQVQPDSTRTDSQDAPEPEQRKTIVTPRLNATLVPIEPAPGEDTRPCSVKGCKAVIPVSYNYKMCPPCRTRYRSYGNTKRTKWKAEREAFDRELAGLRTKEDERRKKEGMGPLSESPEDLHAWELSIIDDEVARIAAEDSPAPDSHLDQDEPSSSTTNTNTTSALAQERMHLIKAALYPTSDTPGTGGDGAGTFQFLRLPPFFSFTIYSLIAPATPTGDMLLARICTVSHCRKILPGFYRYKRCEQHRAQNRCHSQLKRVRETGGEYGEHGNEHRLGEGDVQGGGPPPGSEKDANAQGGNITLTPTNQHDDQPSSSSLSAEAEHNSTPTTPIPITTPRRPTTHCATPACANLLIPQVRWRHCDICRARERVLRRERKEGGGAGAGGSDAMDSSTSGSRNIGTGPAMTHGGSTAVAGLATTVAGEEPAINTGEIVCTNTGTEAMEGMQPSLFVNGNGEWTEAVVQGAGPSVAMDLDQAQEQESVDQDSISTETETHPSLSAPDAQNVEQNQSGAFAEAPLTQPVSPPPPSPPTAVSTVAPSAAVPPPLPDTYKSCAVTSFPQTFQSVFIVAPVEPEPSSASVGTGSLGPQGELVMQEYKPKPVGDEARGSGGLLIHEYQPGSDVAHVRKSVGEREFREMVQRDQKTSTGMVGPSSYHVYRAKTTTPPPTASSTSTSTSAAPSTEPHARPTQSISAPPPQYYRGPEPRHYPTPTQRYPGLAYAYPYVTPPYAGAPSASASACGPSLASSASAPVPTSASISAPTPPYVCHEPPSPLANKPKPTTTKTQTVTASTEKSATSTTSAAPASSSRPVSTPEQAQAPAPDQAQAPALEQAQTSSPAPNPIARQRKPAKPRASRAKPKPAPPPPTPAANHYPYSHPQQHPYPYYVPGYAYGVPHPPFSPSAYHASYGYPPPPPSSTTGAPSTSGGAGTSASASSTTSNSAPGPLYIPYPHPHAYHAFPYPAPPPGYAYLPPPIQPGQYPYTHSSVGHAYAYPPYGVASAQSSGHAHAYPYGGMGYAQPYPHAPQTRDVAFSYYQPRPPGTPDPRAPQQGDAQMKKRKRDGNENANDSDNVQDKGDERGDRAQNDREEERELSAVPMMREQISSNAIAQAYTLRPINHIASTAAPAAHSPTQLHQAPVDSQPQHLADAPVAATSAEPPSPPVNAFTAVVQPQASGQTVPVTLREGQPTARPCAKKTCPRTLPSGTSGTLCERCKARIKRHQAKARQRFKLEPRKSVLLVKDKDKDKDREREDSVCSAPRSGLHPE